MFTAIQGWFISLFKRLFGSASERSLAQFIPRIAETNSHFDKLKSLSHEELRESVQALRGQVRAAFAEEEQKIAKMKVEAEDKKDLKDKMARFDEVEQQEKIRDQKIAKVLDNLLPQVFAAVKETARRLAQEAPLTLTATAYDRELAEQHDFVTIKGEKAIWNKSWKAGGQVITWNMVHYDVQLIGGMTLHQGSIAEMATGEGKTLVAILPAFLNALAGKGVHIVTVNDYLAKRDAAWMAPLCRFHGISVDCIDQHEPYSEARQKAYQADITYGTNSEFGFDYLRDNMVSHRSQKVQRGHNYAIVDEVDSVLIDDARTPLIISGPASYQNHDAFHKVRPYVHQLYNAQKKIVAQFLQEARKSTQSDNEEEQKARGLALFRAYRGLPKHKSLISYLSERGNKQLLATTEDYYLEDNSRLMPEADEPLLFTIDVNSNTVDLTDKGIHFLGEKSKDAEFFVLPNLAEEMAKIKASPKLSDAEKVAAQQKLTQAYNTQSSYIHMVNQLLKAYTLFEEGIDYVVLQGKVKLIDEKTGRILDGRRYSDGLHQAIEAKENVKIEEATQTYATITPQNQFRMYKKLSGMTGTAQTEATEFWDIYKLPVTTIPTNRPIARLDEDDKIYRTHEQKLDAVAKEVKKLVAAGRPVLVGTASVIASEAIQRKLGVPPQYVLNAKNHHREAQIIEEAGRPGRVTVATNMAGRGTDIKLTPEAKAAGGLAVVGTERHESPRVDRQLRGRSGRQGDTGSSQFFVSLEDDLIAHFKHSMVGQYLDKILLSEPEEAIQDHAITKFLRDAQDQIGQGHFARRKRSLAFDNVLNMQRKVIYKNRDHALYGSRIKLDIMYMLHQTIQHFVAEAQPKDDPQYLATQLLSILGLDLAITQRTLHGPIAKVTQNIYNQALEIYESRTQKQAEQLFAFLQKAKAQHDANFMEVAIPLQGEQVPFRVNLEEAYSSKGSAVITAMQSQVILHLIDEHWKNHLLAMENLKDAVRSAVYEQKDPLLIYKFEGLTLFKTFMQNLYQETIKALFQLAPDLSHAVPVDEDAVGDDMHNFHESNPADEEASHAKPATSLKSARVAKRNDRVTVQYADRTIKQNVKYKTVEADIVGKRCKIIT